MTNETEARSALMELHRQICFENGDHPDEVDTFYSIGADAITRADLSDAKDARIAELEAKLLNIVSHATCGTMKYKDQSINDVSVQVTKIRNKIYEEGKKLGAEAAEAKLHIYEGRREAVDFINAQDRIAELEAKLAKALAVLLEYRTKTPLGHQPHMIAHRADAIIAEIQGNP